MLSHIHKVYYYMNYMFSQWLLNYKYRIILHIAPKQDEVFRYNKNIKLATSNSFSTTTQRPASRQCSNYLLRSNRRRVRNARDKTQKHVNVFAFSVYLPRTRN